MQVVGMQKPETSIKASGFVLLEPVVGLEPTTCCLRSG
jgi:hypothetical protein